MATLRIPELQVRVLTYKEGLFSKIAHDLEIDVTRGEITTAHANGALQSLRASLEPASLRVLHAIVDGQARPMGQSDRNTIENNLRDDVLEVRKHSSLTFASDHIEVNPDQLVISGQLELHGTRRALTLRATANPTHWLCSIELDQRDFGIKPFSAMLGTLKIKPHVRVVISVPRGFETAS